jgi:GNAT superfamily N-acetyltransferase
VGAEARSSSRAGSLVAVPRGAPQPRDGVTFRAGGRDDARTAFDVFVAAIADLGRRRDEPTFSAPADPDALWPERRPLFEHLAAACQRFWIAEDGRGPVGYARSFVREGVLQLTDFFVLPRAQGRGVGGELLARAFPASAAPRLVIATPDSGALIRYLRSGVRMQAPILGLEGRPREEPLASDLRVEPILPGAAQLDALAALDRANLGFARGVDHRYLAATRDGMLLRRRGRAVAYGYGGVRTGPAGVLDARDLPALLSLLEAAAAQRGVERAAFEVSGRAGEAVGHLLARGFRPDPFGVYLLADERPPALERHVFLQPSFFC